MNAIDKEISYIKNSIKIVHDYPKPGIRFFDITSILIEPIAYALTIKLLSKQYCDLGFTKIIGTEARGFLFGAPVALTLGIGFVPVRKPGKLPRNKISESYILEYGADKLEIHQDAIISGDKVLIVDDILASGGTACATINLVRRLGGAVTDAAFIINIDNLEGESMLTNLGVKSFSLIKLKGC